MNIAATPATPTAPPAAPPPAPPAPAPSRSPMTARSRPGQRSVSRIPDYSSKAAQVPDVDVPIDDGDIGGYGDSMRVEQGTGRVREIPPDGVKFPTLDANELKGEAQKPAPAPKSEDLEDGDETSEQTPAEKAAAQKAKDLTADLGEPEEGDEEGEEPSAEAPAPAATPGKKDARNYAVFQDPTMEKIARSLPNHLYAEFARLAPQWKAAMEELPKLREAANKVPSFHYEHPEGYLLTPEWPQIQTEFSRSQSEVNHWDRQLLAIENGESWQDLVGYDERGNPKYQEIPAPKDGRVDIRARLHAQNSRLRADNKLINTQAAAQQLVTGYDARRRQALETVKQHQKKLFPTIDPDKLEGEDKDAYDTAGQLIAEIDPSFAKHPATDFARLMYVTMLRVSRQGLKWKQELEKTKATLKGKKLSQNTAIPSGGDHEGETDDMIPIEHD